MTTANKITIARLILIPIFMGVLLLDKPWSWPVALAIFILAGVTDSLDGWVARKYNQVTNVGKFLDPLADKLLVMAALLIFLGWGRASVWAVAVILTREFAVTGLRQVAALRGKVIAAAMSGKVKTALEIVCICVMLTPLHSVTLAGSVDLDLVCVWLMTIATVLSGAEYFIRNKDVLGEAKDPEQEG